jgi:hypothetical protein
VVQTFRDVRIDLAARQLWHGTVEIHLTRKAFDLRETAGVTHSLRHSRP